MPKDPPGTLSVLLRPRMLLLHLTGITAVGTAVGLGLWQLDSWQESRIDHAARVATLDPVPLQDLIGPDDPFPRDGVGRPVSFAGEWLPEGTVVVDRRLHDDRIGAWMVTPFVVCDDSGCADASAIPVVVGWAPSVDEVPDPPTGPAELTGWLQPAESSGEPDPDPDDDVLTAVRIAELLPRVDRDLYGAYVALESPDEAREGMVPVTPESYPDPPASAGLRNFLYGAEWWVFASFAAFLWFRWSRDEVLGARRRTDPDEQPDDQADDQPDGQPADEAEPDRAGSQSAGAARIPSGP